MISSAHKEQAMVEIAYAVSRLPTLTPRETEVLDLILMGYTNKEVGQALKISPRTIEVHRARIMLKLGARSTVDLVRLVLTGRLQPQAA